MIGSLLRTPPSTRCASSANQEIHTVCALHERLLSNLTWGGPELRNLRYTYPAHCCSNASSCTFVDTVCALPCRCKHTTQSGQEQNIRERSGPTALERRATDVHAIREATHEAQHSSRQPVRGPYCKHDIVNGTNSPGRHLHSQRENVCLSRSVPVTKAEVMAFMYPTQPLQCQSERHQITFSLHPVRPALGQTQNGLRFLFRGAGGTARGIAASLRFAEPRKEEKKIRETSTPTLTHNLSPSEGISLLMLTTNTRGSRSHTTERTNIRNIFTPTQAGFTPHVHDNYRMKHDRRKGTELLRKKPHFLRWSGPVGSETLQHKHIRSEGGSSPSSKARRQRQTWRHHSW